MGGRGLPSQLTFDYDEIDDLEFENLLNDPHGPHGPFGNHRHSVPFWERLAALFRKRDGSSGIGYLGGYRAGGYQAVPTGAQGGFAGIHYDDDEFLRHEEDAELMSNEQIRRITSFVKGQTNINAAAEDSLSDEPERPQEPTPSDPLIEVANEDNVPRPEDESLSASASTAQNLPGPRPMNTFTTFRPKRRGSAATAASAAALFGSSQVSGSVDDRREEDEGFGQFQTATRQNEAEDPIQVPEDHSAVTEATSDASQSVEGPTAEENKFEEGPSTPVEEIEPVTPSEAVTEQANETVQNVQTDPLQAI